MKFPEKPRNEKERLSVLGKLEILDTFEEVAYDDLTLIASYICDCPISLVSLIDEKRQWFKSHRGLGARETPRDFAFCAHAIMDDELFYVQDSDNDERFSDNPLVTGAPHVKFYAGIPLKVRGEYNVGTLCVIDNKPRVLSEEQKNLLKSLARQVEAQLELRLRVKELEALDRMRSEFIAMVSHELRTPLTSIYGSLAILNSGVVSHDSEKVKTLTVAAFENSNRLMGIVNDILDLTKIESGGFKIDKRVVDFNGVVKTAILNLTDYFQKCHVAVALDLDGSIGDVSIDDSRFIQIINNIASNAAKFSPEGSTVEVSTLNGKDHLKLLIRDHGAGIPEELHGEMFKKFSKASVSGKGKLPGTGLGLNIAKQLVELHKGSIWFESKKDFGTTFIIEVPKT